MICPVKVAASAAIAMFCLPSALSAAPLSAGSFGLAGSFALQGAQLSTANSLSFGNGGSVFVISPGTFDLAGVGGFGAAASLRDIPSLTTFTPLSAFVTAGNGATVNLLNLTVAHRSTNFLNFYGDVDLLAPGFDTTRGFLSGAATTLDGRMLNLALSIAARPSPTPPLTEQPPATEEEPPAPPPPATKTTEEQIAETPQQPTPVPEPWSAAGLALGLGSLALARRRKTQT